MLASWQIQPGWQLQLGEDMDTLENAAVTCLKCCILFRYMCPHTSLNFQHLDVFFYILIIFFS